MERLATYGTLGPGRPNHHVVKDIEGHWSSDSVRGHLVDAGWGAGQGFPGIRLDPTADPVRVDILESIDLGAHWERLDAFEGPGYVRMKVVLDSGRTAQIYALSESPDIR